ncbi:Zn-dependent exopeptidase [Daldinia loculata]|nr:Zn-dependent exopeptidase [Daldinia loculata]
MESWSRRYNTKYYSVETDRGTDKGVQTLPVLINSTALHEHLQALQKIADAHHGNRITGSAGHNQTIQYIQDHMKSQGYYVEVQPFHDLIQINSKATLWANGEAFDVEPMGWSPECAFTERPLIAVDGVGCKAADYPQEALDAVVMVGAGGCSLSDKSIAAGEAGAIGLLMYEFTQLTPCLGGLNDRHIPSAKIAYRDAERILAHRHPLSVNIFDIYMQYKEVSSSSPGINDNASGVASLLEIATQLSRFKTNSTVKFAFWTASEPCLLGSKHWMYTTHKEELQEIRLYLDANMLGSPNGALKVYDGHGSSFGTPGPHGSREAETILTQGFEAQGVNFTRTEISNRSDYATFFDAQIPFAGLFSGANGLKTWKEVGMFGGDAGVPYDANYHEPDDNIKNINMKILLQNTKALAHAVGVYGRSLDNFPASAIRHYGTSTGYLYPLLASAWVAYYLLS